MTSWLDVPIFIPTRDRLTDLQALLEWLRDNGYWNVCLIDNDSTYPPLVKFLKDVDDHDGPYGLVHLTTNYGSRCPWLPHLAHLRQGFYVVTDPDVVPTEACPANLVGHLAGLLERHDVPKAGVGLYTRDLGTSFHDWYRETTFQRADRWLGDCFSAPVETTFALYRPGSEFTFEAVRSAHPYEARHLSWYREGSPTDEDKYYLSRARVAGLDTSGQATGGSDWAGFATMG